MFARAVNVNRKVGATPRQTLAIARENQGNEVTMNARWMSWAWKTGGRIELLVFARMLKDAFGLFGDRVG